MNNLSVSGTLDSLKVIADYVVEAAIEDTGARYDPYEEERIEEKELQKPLEERVMGGLGVYLAIQGVDKYFYERVGERNRNIFVVNCPSAN